MEIPRASAPDRCDADAEWPAWAVTHGAGTSRSKPHIRRLRHRAGTDRGHPDRPAVMSSTTWLWSADLGGQLRRHPTQEQRGDLGFGDLEDVVHVVADQHDTETLLGETAAPGRAPGGSGRPVEGGGRLVEQHHLAGPRAPTWRWQRSAGWPPESDDLPASARDSSRVRTDRLTRACLARGEFRRCSSSSETADAVRSRRGTCSGRCPGSRPAPGPGNDEPRYRDRRPGAGCACAYRLRPRTAPRRCRCCECPAMYLTSVDLPAPLSPTRAVTSPARTVEIHAHAARAPGRSSC